MIKILNRRIGVQSLIKINKIDINYILEWIYLRADGNIVSYDNTFKKKSLAGIHTLVLIMMQSPLLENFVMIKGYSLKWQPCCPREMS